MLLVGEPLPDDLPPGMPLDNQNLLTDIPAGLPSDLLTRRPDIVEAEENLLAANANIGAARAAFFPTISLTGNFGTLSPTLGGLFKPGSAAWAFRAADLAADLRRAARTRPISISRTSQKNIQIATYEKAIQTAFREVADGLAARGTYDQQIAALERVTFAEQRRLDLSDLRYQQRRGQLSVGADRADRSVFSAAVADHGACAAADEPGRSVSVPGRWLDRA